MKTTNTYQNTAWLYDYDNRDNLTADIPFYIEYATKTGEDVLELGCGTGRVAIKMAEAGFNVTGLELSDTILEIFKEKLENVKAEVADRITLVKGNMVSFNIGKKYGLIIAPFRAFQALSDEKDVINSISCISEHLAEDGLFIVNVFRPFKQLDESWCYPETIQWETIDGDTGCRIVKKHWGDKIDTQNQIVYPHYAFEITHPDGKCERIEDDLELKYYYYDQLKEYLINGGFEITEEYGWYDRSNIKEGRELIFVCRKK